MYISTLLADPEISLREKIIRTTIEKSKKAFLDIVYESLKQFQLLEEEIEAEFDSISSFASSKKMDMKSVSASKTTFGLPLRERRNSMKRNTSNSVMMRKRGYQVPFSTLDHLNGKFLASNEYHDMCNYYGIIPQQLSISSVDEENNGSSDCNDTKEDDGDPPPNNNMSQKALRLLDRLLSVKRSQDWWDQLSVSIITNFFSLDEGSIHRSVLKSVDHSIQNATTTESSVLNNTTEVKVNSEETQDTYIEFDRAVHGIKVTTLLLRAATAYENCLPSQIINIRKLVENIDVSSQALRKRLQTDSDILRLLSQGGGAIGGSSGGTVGSMILATVEQYEMFIATKERLDEAQHNIETRQKLNEEISSIERKMEIDQEHLFHLSRISITAVKYLGSFYFSGTRKPPGIATELVGTMPANHIADGFRWLLSRAIGSSPHRGIRGAATAALSIFISAFSRRMSVDTAFVVPSDKSSTIKADPLSSPEMLTEANDLALTLLKRVEEARRGASFEYSISDIEVGLLAQSCVIHKDAKKQDECITYLVKLWRHPNSMVRHVAIRGVGYLSQAGMFKTKDARTSIGKHINKRVQESDCQDQEQQMLNKLMMEIFKP